MATFDPVQDYPNKTDYTRASQGTKADTSLGGLLDNAGQFVDNAVKTGASIFKEAIRDDVTKAVDEIQSLFTGNGPTPGTGQDPKKPLPQDIVSRADRLQALTDKYQTGGLSSSHYWTLLDAEARSLRSKYAGHREEIDNIFADLVGGIPANRLIEAIKHDATKKDAAAQEYRHWEDKAYGSPEYTAAMQKGYQPTVQELKSWGSSWNLRKAKNEVLMGELNYAEKATEVGQKRGIDAASAAGVDIVQDVWRAGTVATSSDFAKLQAKAEDFQKQGKPIPTELTKALEGLAAAGEMEATKRFEQMLNAPTLDNGQGGKTSLSAYLSPDSLRKVRDGFEANKAAMFSPLRSGSFGTMTFNDRLVKANDSGDLSNLMASEPMVKGIRSFEKAVGPQIAQQYLNKNDELLKGMDGFAKRLVNSSLVRPTTLDQDLLETRSKLTTLGKSFDEAAVARETIKDYIKIAQSRETLPEGRAAVVNKLFATPDLYKNLSSPQDREALYSMLVNRQTTEAIVMHGTEADKQKYFQWVDTVAGLRLSEPALTIKSNVIDANTTVGVKYDQTSHSFSADSRARYGKMAKGEYLMDTDGQARIKVQEAVSSLNNTIQGWATIAKANGKSVDEINEIVRRNIQALGGFDIYDMRYRRTKDAKPDRKMSDGEGGTTE